MTAQQPGDGSATNVAIIMDGNGRWATERGLPVLEGHRRGARTLKQTVKDAVGLGIEQLTVYAFSTENWARPRDEVAGLMEMFGKLIVSETPELHDEGVRMVFVGRRSEVSEQMQEQMAWAEAETAENPRMTLFVAFNYGGRAEILDAAERYEGGGEEAFRELLYEPEMRDPELVIRTSGEERLSNFLLWQSAYSELFFTDVLWPDFDRSTLEEALQAYASRRRRFGARE
ncbi:MAG: di-trans,poly-cis-decaprenylcistransferase [Solirubrobacterales bacterium]|nr:di-trans,poly-cis-decaprenylcistransferase [Solirubrobacterales bacterium]MCB8970177.1 di-trans,poly-cis-decaprenylcistransferase [Thermoleophilales bacterium]MCO5326727.1 polyprenyl diphosphate synthase [Solirubrobacterales bacterium]